MLGVETVGFEENLSVSEDFFKVHINPNPFTAYTILSYNLAETSYVTLRVFDSFGRVVAEPLNEFQQIGEQKVTWNAEGLPTGIYYCRLQAGNYTETKKLVLLR
jgi:hypothetical protein